MWSNLEENNKKDSRGPGFLVVLEKLNEQVDQLVPSGIVVHLCESLGHIISNKQTNKQTD